MQCQLCDKHATIHLTEILDSQKTERHLCEECALKEGVTIKTHVPINELLENLSVVQEEAKELGQLSCPQCDITWSEFRKNGLLGCPNDYLAFEKPLQSLIERAQEGAINHVGRVPRKSDGSISRQLKLLRLRQNLRSSLEEEDYQ